MVSRAAARAVLGLEADNRRRIRARIGGLADNPRPPGCVKLSGAPERWRVRVGDYRVIYSVEDATLIVLVIEVGNRREVYR